jgi:hypothetical protein
MTRYIYQYLSSFTHYPLPIYIPYSHITSRFPYLLLLVCVKAYPIVHASAAPYYPSPLSPHVGTCATIYPALIASSQPSSYILVTYSSAPPTHCCLSISEFLLQHMLHLVPTHTSRLDFRRLPHILLLIYIMISPAMHASSSSLLKSP